MVYRYSSTAALFSTWTNYHNLLMQDKTTDQSTCGWHSGNNGNSPYSMHVASLYRILQVAVDWKLQVGS